MRRRGLAAMLVAALVLCQAPKVAAFDPSIIVIAEWFVNNINPALKVLDELQVGINNRQRWYMWAKHCTDAMRVVRTRVHGIRRELRELPCSFQFSPRVEILRGMFERPSRFCAPSWDAIWGTGSDLPWDDDRARLAERQGALVHNLLSNRAENEHGSWDRIFAEQLEGTGTTRWSVGEAERDMAANVAWLAVLTADNKRLDEQAVLLEELRWATRRSRTRSERLQAATVWETLAAMPRASSGPDPLGMLEVKP